MLKRFRLLKELEFPCLWELKQLQSHRTNKFVCARISFPSDAADLRSRVTPSPIGSKRNGSYSPRPVAAEEVMKDAAANLAQALRERLAAIRDEQSRCDEARHIARLRAVSEKIDKLREELPRPVDPQLAHYLQRKSYDKALEYLERVIAASGT